MVSIPVIVILMSMSLTLIVDGFMIQALALKLLNRLKQDFEETQALSEKQKISEMKDVIANVAHDLKTVRGNLFNSH